MQDPERWSSDPSAPAGMEAMLHAARSTGPSAAEQAALGVKLGVSTTPWWLSPFAKVIGVAGLVVGVGAGGSALLSAEQQPGARSTSTPNALPAQKASADPHEEAANPQGEAAKPQEEQAEGGPEEAALPPTVAPRQDASPRAHSAPSEATGTRSPSEAELLSQARSVLTSRPEKALSLLSTHARLYPAGVLAEERELLKVRALKETGRNAEAQRQAEQFRESHPDSVHHLPN